MRKPKGLPTHGWLILDKPQGLTSTQAVSRVKRLFEAQKAGQRLRSGRGEHPDLDHGGDEGPHWDWKAV